MNIETKKGRIIVISLFLFAYLIIGWAAKVNSDAVNMPLWFSDARLDSVITIAEKVSDWPWSDTTTVRTKTTSFPAKIYITLDDDYNWKIFDRYHWTGRSTVASYFLPLAAGISEDSGTDAYLAMLLTVYPGSRARTFYGAEKDSVAILDTTLTDMAYMIFYHDGGSEGDAPDSVVVVGQ